MLKDLPRPISVIDFKKQIISTLVISEIRTARTSFRSAARGVLELIFAGYVPLASQSPYPVIVYSVAYYRPQLSRFLANMLFSRFQLSHFLFMNLPYKCFK